MSKVIDLIYYYVYQNSRKNKHEKDHHTVAVMIVTLYIVMFLGAINTGFIFPLLFKPLGIRSEVTLIFIAMISLMIGTKINSSYLKRRKSLVKQYDKKYSYKTRNKYLDSAVLTVSFLFMILITLFSGYTLRKTVIFFLNN